jgi:pimeloyl-ACP methyl ester carboxylesterase
MKTSMHGAKSILISSIMAIASFSQTVEAAVKSSGTTEKESLYRNQDGKEGAMGMYDKALSALPPSYNKIMIPTRYGQTFCLAAEDRNKPPLILLHGQCLNSANWIWGGMIIEEFRKYFSVYAIDILGEPGKSDPTRISFKGPEYADWLLDVLNYLKIEKVNMVGASYGGWFALKFGITYPERINKLVLASPGGITGVKMSYIFKCIQFGFQADEGIHKTIRLLYEPQTVPPEVDAFLINIFKSFKIRTSPAPTFSDRQLKKLNMPILYLGGALDAIFPVQKAAKRLRSILPNAIVKLLPNANHALTPDIQSEIVPFLLQR